MTQAKSENKPRILVVDDHPHNVELVEAMLIPQGYLIFTAYDGVEALEAVEKHDPDLIILDIMMPKMDGFEVARRLRADEQRRAIPILMLTALREVQDKVKGLEAGADDFLSKPFNRVELLARVRSLLRIKQLHDELQAKNALLEQVLTRYVSREIAQTILENPDENLRLGGRTCVISVLFADIRGFTHFAERRDAALVLDVLNRIFNVLTPLVFEYGGTMDKYLGDAIMAFFGAPLASENDAERAIRTAWAMQQAFLRMREGDELLQKLHIGIGIATGEAVVGNVGSEQVMDYTAIGNTPNTAKRLQEIAHGGEILIDNATYERVKDLVVVRPIEPIVLKGHSEPIRAYRVEEVKEPTPA
ncbi:hypothetical protein ARMA_2188 [Ardenticatena maritima]|uniref:histidine kinase n=1 Tax=Ardenticatena maritima TaxID=872965 RepID=A0A0M8K878_9CHLR|nr:response regulator [Ardenticatena maritima]KPL89143.1 hypothetical protein SE16_01080 [Ardenticatena maritima]GAP63765.1 hypothetical protein ARMA_2188 [Ardenticatena maritima]